MKVIHCEKCRRAACNDEIALTLKLFGKRLPYVLCYRCLSETLCCSVGELQKRAEFFKLIGCELFKTDYTGQMEGAESRCRKN